MDEIIFTDCPKDPQGNPKRTLQLYRQRRGQCVFCAVSASEDHRIGCPQIRCGYCKKRRPTEEEAYWKKTFLVENGQGALDQVERRKEKGFCLCSRSQSSLWRKNFLIITAAVVRRHPDFEKNAATARAATDLFKLAVSSWIKGKPTNATERQKLKRLTDHADSLFYHEFELVLQPWKTSLRRLLGSARSSEYFEQMLATEQRRYHRRFRAMAKFLSSLTRDPSFTFWLSTGFFADLNPYGYDPGGMKEKLYNDHPEYQAILDGMMEDRGYDECAAAIKALPDGFGAGVQPDSEEDDWWGWLEHTRKDGLKNWEYLDGMEMAQEYDPNLAALENAEAEAEAEAYEAEMSYSELRDKVYWKHPELREHIGLEWYKTCDALPTLIQYTKTTELVDLRIYIWGMFTGNRFALGCYKRLENRRFQNAQLKQRERDLRR
jgi:hypothetical protein